MTYWGNYGTQSRYDFAQMLQLACDSAGDRGLLATPLTAFPVRRVPSYRLKRGFKDGTRSQTLEASGSARPRVRSHDKRTVKGPSLVAVTGVEGQGCGLQVGFCPRPAPWAIVRALV